MATATKRANQAMATALAKQVYGKNAYTEFREKALTEEQKVPVRARAIEVAARRKELETPLKVSSHSVLLTILPAAEFVCDVNGDHPSIDQLRAALAKAMAHVAVVDEDLALKREQRTLNTHGKRCNVLEAQHLIPGFPVSIQLCDGDTWEEVVGKLQRKLEEKGR